MYPATTIDEVIQQLESIIDWSKNNQSRLGCFPALYKRVTIQVKEGITNGEFQDGNRMERLDVIFANRYLHAFRQFQNGQPPTTTWQLAFDARNEWWTIVLQHLLLGMNAHINLDLGIAAAECMKGNDLEELQPDFYKINDILVSLINDVQDQLKQIWPLMGWFDIASGDLDELLAKFGIEIARDHAWDVAQQMANTPLPGWDNKIATLDAATRNFGDKVLNPKKWWLRAALTAIRLTEVRSANRIIDILNE